MTDGRDPALCRSLIVGMLQMTNKTGTHALSHADVYQNLARDLDVCAETLDEPSLAIPLATINHSLAKGTPFAPLIPIHRRVLLEHAPFGARLCSMWNSM